MELCYVKFCLTFFHFTASTSTYSITCQLGATENLQQLIQQLLVNMPTGGNTGTSTFLSFNRLQLLAFFLKMVWSSPVIISSENVGMKPVIGHLFPSFTLLLCAVFKSNIATWNLDHLKSINPPAENEGSL